MIRRLSPAGFEVQVSDRRSAQIELDLAESFARAIATRHCCGVLVTRHSHTLYTVAVSQEVAHGETREQHEWRGAALQLVE